MFNEFEEQPVSTNRDFVQHEYVPSLHSQAQSETEIYNYNSDHDAELNAENAFMDLDKAHGIEQEFIEEEAAPVFQASKKIKEALPTPSFAVKTFDF